MAESLVFSYFISVVGGIVAGLIVKGFSPLWTFLVGIGFFIFYFLLDAFFGAGLFAGVLFVFAITLFLVFIAYLLKYFSYENGRKRNN